MVYDVMQEAFEQKQITVSTHTYSDHVQFGGGSGHKVQDAVLIENGDINGVILRPIIDEHTDIGKDHYLVESTEDAAILEDWKHEYWPFKMITQVVSKTPAALICPPGFVEYTDWEGNTHCVGGTLTCENPGYEVVCKTEIGGPDNGSVIFCRDPFAHGVTGNVVCNCGDYTCTAECLRSPIDGLWYPWCTTSKIDDPTEGDEWIHSSIESKYELMQNAFFLVMVGRKAPEDDFMEEVAAATERPPYTEITFGITSKKGWALTIPYGEEPYLWEFDPDDENAEPSGWVRREWTYGSLSEKDSREGSTAMFWYWIGVIDGKICVSENGFKGTFAYYQSYKLGPEQIEKGKVTITQWPGQLWFAIRPLKMAVGTLTRNQVSVPNENWVDLKAHGQVWGASRPGLSINDDIALTNDFVFWLGTGNGGYRWILTITPGTYTDFLPDWPLLADVTSYSCPTLTAFRMRYEATITDNGAGAHVSYEDYVGEVTADLRAEEQASAMSIMTLMNHHGEATNMHEGRLVELLDVGFEFTDATDDLVATLNVLWTLEPEWYGSWCRVPLTDLMTMLAMYEIDFEGCMLAGMSAYDALVFLAERAGFGPGWYDFEDFVTLLDGYPPLIERFKFDVGTSYADAMREVAMSAKQAALWCDSNVLYTGCPYCRTKRTADNWQTHQDNGWNSSGCLAADVDRAGLTGIDKVCFANPEDATDPLQPNELLGLEVTRRNIGRWEYANRVTVLGQDTAGRAVSKTYRDWNALYGPVGADYFGFPISKTEKADNLGTQAKVNQRALELFQKLAAKPLYLRATALAQTGLSLGDVIHIEGGETKGVDDKVFRIVGLEHNLQKDSPATSVMTGRYMRDA